MAKEALPPLEPREVRKRRRERLAIVGLIIVFTALSIAEFRLTRVSSSLPLVNSIFFFGLLNINIIILIAITWLAFRNLGKVIMERRRKILGSRLKTKLVTAFLAFSIIPTLILFAISSFYINSSFDKWFSIRIQNTLQASLEIKGVYYKNVSQTAMHFAEHIANILAEKFSTGNSSEESMASLEKYLKSQVSLLALDSVEYYPDVLSERAQAANEKRIEGLGQIPRLALDVIDKAFSGEAVSLVQHIGAGDLIRCVVPVKHDSKAVGSVQGVVAVNVFIPISLVNRVDEIAGVFEDYKETNPLKYPIKTTYFVILVMITLVIIVVATWIGVYIARELTVPVERLVEGAQAVGRGNLDVEIPAAGHDEIAVLVGAFNKMTHDLKENQQSLTLASKDLAKRREQLEAILANIGTGVVGIDPDEKITTFNRAASDLLGIRVDARLREDYHVIFSGELSSFTELIDRTVHEAQRSGQRISNQSQWNMRNPDGSTRTFSVTVTSLQEGSGWGAVAVVDDLSLVVKGQREMAWREVARRIAHEIKNPLTPIKLSAQRLQRRLGRSPGKDSEFVQVCTETIIKHTDELKEMVNEFSNFARFPEISPAPNDLNQALREVIALYEQAHPDVLFYSDLETKLPIFEFDRDQIKRVALNLLDNAVFALKAGQMTRQKEVRISTHFNDQLKIAAIKIEDNGPGMAEDVKERIFEPYFSTKNEGTGLGLAIAKRIINDHDGFIRVNSGVGDGTQFLIELPTTPKQSTLARDTVVGVKDTPGA